MTNFGLLAEANRLAIERYERGRSLTIKYADMILGAFRTHLGETMDGMREANPAIPDPSQVFLHHPVKLQYVSGLPAENCLTYHEGIWNFGLGLRFSQDSLSFASVLIRGAAVDPSLRKPGEYAVTLKKQGEGLYLPIQLPKLIQQITGKIPQVIDRAEYPSNKNTPILINYEGFEIE